MRILGFTGYRNCVEMLDDMEERRFIKSHLPLSLLPHNLLDTAKVVYVARNPKAWVENLLFLWFLWFYEF